jgi:PiT family inorganic phosphate transporter
MTDLAASPLDTSFPKATRPKLDARVSPLTAILFFGLLAAGVLFTAYSLYSDASDAGVRTTTWLPFILMGVALFVALAFEFVNGFHDTANAVATAAGRSPSSSPPAG